MSNLGQALKVVAAKVARLRADASLNVAAGVLDVNQAFKPFDKQAYLLKSGLKQSQKDWCAELDDNDGVITVTITNETGKYPVAYWLSNFKAVEGVTVDANDEVIIPAGKKYEIKAGVILQA